MWSKFVKSLPVRAQISRRVSGSQRSSHIYPLSVGLIAGVEIIASEADGRAAPATVRQTIVVENVVHRDLGNG